MKRPKAVKDRGKIWTKTRVQGLYRHRNQRYYARLFVDAKEKWVPLETTLFEIAKARMAEEPQIADLRQGREIKRKALTGRLTIAQCADLYRVSLNRRIELKAATVDFWMWSLTAVLESWPVFSKLDVSKVTSKECEMWAARMARR